MEENAATQLNNTSLDETELPITGDGSNIDFHYRPDFGIKVNTNHSTISVAIDVYKYARNVVNFARATRGLDVVFKMNRDEAPYIGWQYFGSKSGAMRTYPGLFETKPIDPRYRPWYVCYNILFLTIDFHLTNNLCGHKVLFLSRTYKTISLNELLIAF